MGTGGFVFRIARERLMGGCAEPPCLHMFDMCVLGVLVLLFVCGFFVCGVLGFGVKYLET